VSIPVPVPGEGDFDAPGRAAVSAVPTAVDPPFVVATGFECSAPRIASGGRHDQLRKLGHRERFAEDFALTRALGIRYLRFGIPFHEVAADADRLDWSWTDRAMAALAEHGIEPIVDLLHFGVPDDLWGIGDPRLVGRFATYAGAFARRFPWVRWYTPVNEPYITALHSTKSGWWNERATDDRTFAHAIANVVEALLRGTEAIRAHRDDATVLQSDGCDEYRPGVAGATPLAAFLDEQRFVGFDLTLGRTPAPAVLAWLASGAVDDARLGWFEDHAIRERFVVGLDHYSGNERLVALDGGISTNPQPRGFAALARDYHDRYGRPFWLAETNAWEPGAVAWLAREWKECLELLAEGRPLTGVCWYSLTDQVDWDVALREDRGRINPVGLVDLDRGVRRVGAAYARLARDVADGRFIPLDAEVLPAA